MKTACPNCGTERTLLVEDEMTTIGAIISLGVDFLLLGPLVFLGLFGHELVETRCPNCGQTFLVKLNMRLQAYKSSSYLYSIGVYAVLAAVLFALIFGVWQ